MKIILVSVVCNPVSRPTIYICSAAALPGLAWKLLDYFCDYHCEIIIVVTCTDLIYLHTNLVFL